MLELAAEAPLLLGCAAGRTYAGTYRAVAARAPAGRVTAVAMDEYVVDGEPVPEEAHFSCVGELRRALPGIEVWRPEPGYDERIAAAGGIGLFLAGCGASDGHIGFRGPGAARGSRTEVVRIADSTRRDNLATFPGFRSLDEVPAHGISVGLATLLDARSLVVALVGEDKRRAAEELLARTSYDPSWPASLVHEHPAGEIHLAVA